MPETVTIRLTQRIGSVRTFNAIGDACADPSLMEGDEEQATAVRIETAIQAERARMVAELERQKSRFAQLCQTVGSLAADLTRLHQETLANNRSDIARLAVEIARKIVHHKVNQGDYDLQGIIEEALKRAPTRQEIVVHVNPEDLPQCQQHQQENRDSPFAELDFVADWSVGRGECLVETPKGIVKSFIEDHLARIGEALEKVE